MNFSWIYVFLTAFSSLIRQIGGNQVEPSLILLIGCTIAVIYFHAVNFRHVKSIYEHCFEYKKQWLYVSGIVAIMWLCGIYSPSMIGASLQTMVYFSVLGIWGTAWLYFKGVRNTLSSLISLIGLISLLIYVIITNLLSHTGTTELLGIALAMLGGTSGFLYSKQSSSFMALSKLSASQVLAVRFYLTIVVCIFLLPSHPLAGLNPHTLSITALIGVFSLIIPLYFSQKGIEKAGPELNSIICSTSPFVAAILEQLCFRNLAWESFAIYALYSLFAALPFITRLVKTSLKLRTAER